MAQPASNEGMPKSTWAQRLKNHLGHSHPILVSHISNSFPTSTLSRRQQGTAQVAGFLSATRETQSFWFLTLTRPSPGNQGIQVIFQNIPLNLKTTKNWDEINFSCLTSLQTPKCHIILHIKTPNHYKLTILCNQFCLYFHC